MQQRSPRPAPLRGQPSGAAETTVEEIDGEEQTGDASAASQRQMGQIPRDLCSAPAVVMEEHSSSRLCAEVDHG